MTVYVDKIVGNTDPAVKDRLLSIKPRAHAVVHRYERFVMAKEGRLLGEEERRLLRYQTIASMTYRVFAALDSRNVGGVLAEIADDLKSPLNRPPLMRREMALAHAVCD